LAGQVDRTSVWPELSPAALARLQAELGAYALHCPDGPIAMIDLTDVDLTEVIRTQLIPTSASSTPPLSLSAPGLHVLEPIIATA
jgi:hypothetical protein